MGRKEAGDQKILRTGKAGVHVLDRSVKKRLEGVYDRGRHSVLSCDPITLEMSPEDAGYLAVIEAANNLLSENLVPDECRTVVLLPTGSKERILRRVEAGVREGAEVTGVKITGGHTEVTSAVTRPVVMAAAAGKDPGAQGQEGTSAASPAASFGRDVVISGWAGLEGTYLLAAGRQEELSRRFPVSILSAAQAMRAYLYCGEAAGVYRRWTAERKERPLLINASEGGIFAALWELSEKTGAGFDIGLLEIPILQETIEITDACGINPYQMESAGCMIHLASDGRALQSCFEDHGIRAAYVGHLTDTHDKCIRNGDDLRSLDLPGADPLQGQGESKEPECTGKQ